MWKIKDFINRFWIRNHFKLRIEFWPQESKYHNILKESHPYFWDCFIIYGKGRCMWNRVVLWHHSMRSYDIYVTPQWCPCHCKFLKVDRGNPFVYWVWVNNDKRVEGKEIKQILVAWNYSLVGWFSFLTSSVFRVLQIVGEVLKQLTEEKCKFIGRRTMQYVIAIICWKTMHLSDEQHNWKSQGTCAKFSLHSTTVWDILLSVLTL